MVPILDSNGKVLGAIGGLTGLDQPNFLDIVPGSQYGKTGGFMLVAPEQRLVVTATDKTRIMTALPPPGAHPQMDAMMSKGMGTDTWVGPGGVEVLTSGATIATSGWMVGVSLPTEEAYGPIHRVQLTSAGVALALSGIAALLVWWLLQRQLAPLNEAAMALRLRTGMPAHHFPLQVVRQDEIGDVIEGFNALLLELHERERALLGTTKALEVAAALQESTGALAQVGGWQVELTTMKLTWTRETFRIAERDNAVEPPLEEGINLFAPQARPTISAAVQAAIDLGTPYDLELPIIGERGTSKWVRTQGFAVMEDGKTVRLHGTFQDITERKQNELRNSANLAEKTALLNEVHHRVKNNLQVISSLLRLEAARVGPNGSNTKTVLTDMQARVRSMALLHESLYRTGVFASVDLGAYLRQLAQQSFRAFTFDHTQVRLELDLAVVHLGMDQALPCGLLVNELLSNATKHGFPDGRSGVVRVELLALGGGRCRVCVCDDGVGLPHDFDQRREKSLGLQLVGDLSTQLGGALEVGPGPGSHFSVEFDCDREVEA
jgi:two-component sensor histidine kinase/HAMP domain-containing protein